MSSFNIDRRSMFVGGAAASALVSTGASAASKTDNASNRGYDGIYQRLPDLDTESRGDFLLGMSNNNNGGNLSSAARDRARIILADNGIKWDETAPYDKSIALLADDPVIASYAASRSTHQRQKYRLLQQNFHSKADQYLSMMEATDKKGPRPVELNPTMKLPTYTTSEIHTQPGGYVGDPFAGFMYRYGTDWGVLNGRNYQDGAHMAQAAGVAMPEDKKVLRILDLGTSIGQLATSMKKRFPEAEVWGIDAGGPMVRFAHMKAVNMGTDVSFAQRIAEDTKFPDNHFDIVTANILFHEVTEEAAGQIVAETSRILRKGGLFYPIDFYTARPSPRTAWEHFQAFWNHRWNNEDWMLEYARFDMEGSMKKSGLKVLRQGSGGGPAGATQGMATSGNMYGVKA